MLQKLDIYAPNGACDGKCLPFLSLAGLNHPGGAANIDTADDRLGQEILKFIRAVANQLG
jgi:hypothetical protein